MPRPAFGKQESRWRAHLRSYSRARRPDSDSARLQSIELLPVAQPSTGSAKMQSVAYPLQEEFSLMSGAPKSAATDCVGGCLTDRVRQAVEFAGVARGGESPRSGVAM